MGIYDREYYRREGPRYLDMLVPSGAVVKWLLVINVAVFFIKEVAENTGSFWIAQNLTLWAPFVYQGEVWRLVTHAFLHADFWHILFNMLFLWWFGSELEEMYGSKEFLAFYLVGVLAGAAGFLLHGTVNERVYEAPALGASGAVTAVMLLFAIHFPHRTILLMFVIPVPIWLLVLFNVVKDAAGLFDSGNRVAVAAHLGGAAFAGLYYKFHWRITGVWDSLKDWRRSRRRPKLRIYRPGDKKEAVPVGAKLSEVDEHLEAKVDAVLEKVARSGQESLTDQEREILLKASEIYKKRRT